MVVRGEPGIGKSVLLEFARERAEDMRVLSARGVEAESELPFAALAQLVGPILDLRSELPARQRAAIEGALALGSSEGDDRFGVYAATLGLIAEAADVEPLLLVVDDAHWLDSSTAETLRFLARRLASDPVAVVFASRVGEGVGFEAGDLPELTLTGLDRPAAAALLAVRTGVPVAGSVTEERWRATAGNPLALSELALLLGEAELGGGASRCTIRCPWVATWKRCSERRSRRLPSPRAAPPSSRPPAHPAGWTRSLRPSRRSGWARASSKPSRPPGLSPWVPPSCASATR